ncbi:hypothetical protein CALVIDRAFT_193058 [Calocera viscosa TUFC12733]|uniref:Uncharacterized protein n=1 Tax=Calocera viscosa (strain TUFC12733) TaxID=1330018 RepID=A0A167KQX4_CALVF|nr:hypothetical protein CALVIDRAFT_193058 [Calocera viscosa TUFC12733]
MPVAPRYIRTAPVSPGSPKFNGYDHPQENMSSAPPSNPDNRCVPLHTLTSLPRAAADRAPGRSHRAGSPNTTRTTSVGSTSTRTCSPPRPPGTTQTTSSPCLSRRTSRPLARRRRSHRGRNRRSADSSAACSTMSIMRVTHPGRRDNMGRREEGTEGRDMDLPLGSRALLDSTALPLDSTRLHLDSTRLHLDSTVLPLDSTALPPHSTAPLLDSTPTFPGRTPSRRRQDPATTRPSPRPSPSRGPSSSSKSRLLRGRAAGRTPCSLEGLGLSVVCCWEICWARRGIMVMVVMEEIMGMAGIMGMAETEVMVGMPGTGEMPGTAGTTETTMGTGTTTTTTMATTVTTAMSKTMGTMAMMGTMGTTEGMMAGTMVGTTAGTTAGTMVETTAGMMVGTMAATGNQQPLRCSRSLLSADSIFSPLLSALAVFL